MSDNKPIAVPPEITKGAIWRHKATGRLVEVTNFNELAVSYITIGEERMTGLSSRQPFESDFVLTNLIKANNMVAK